MTAIFLMTIGSLLIGAAVAYAMWLDFRVIRYRQDVFKIRDAMWDRMRERGDLELHDHQVARMAINATIRYAPQMSFLSIGAALGNGVRRIDSPIQDAEIQDFVDQTAARTTDYVFRESLFGWVFIPVLKFMILILNIIPERAATEQGNSWTRRFLMSDDMIHDRFCAG